jgi:anti-sigma regulatory factor (Ser/Thr protein kinase)
MAPLPPADRVKIERVLRLQTDSRPDSLADARRQVRLAAAQTRLTEKGVAEMEIMAGELLSNIHRHAYAHDVGPVFLELFHTQRMVTLIVIDRGNGLVAPAVPQTLPPQSALSGRGLYLVARLSDEVKLAVNHGGHGLTIRVSKWFEDPRRTPGERVLAAKPYENRLPPPPS